MNTRWQREPCVLLLNGTFIWLVTFPCSSLVYQPKALFVGETPSRPRITPVLCYFLYKVLFPRPCDSLFARRYYILTLTPSAPCLSFSLSSLVCLDIGSWLQLFGFQLHNVVPGFPKPDVGRLEQTYELMKTQTKTQNWDSSKVSPSTVLYDAVFLVVVVFLCYHYRYPELTNNLAGRRRAQGFFLFFFFSWQQTLLRTQLCALPTGEITLELSAPYLFALSVPVRAGGSRRVEQNLRTARDEKLCGVLLVCNRN